MRKEALIGLAATVLFFFSGAIAADESYYSGSFARLSYVQGDVRVDRGQELGIESGEVNFVLTAGDKLLTGDGLAEVGFGHNNYLRIGSYSLAEMVRLPESGYDDLSLHLHRGRFYFRVSSLPGEKSFGLHTPDASFYLLEEGLYRFEIDEEGRTEAAVVEGRLEAAGQEESVVLSRGDSVTAENGYLMDSGGYRLSDDNFERWNERREEQLARAVYVADSYLPEEIREYEPELAAHGRWVYERPYGYVWVPVVTYVDWRPYLYGRWVWYPRLGWTWISAEPWGWTVYHYGRWHWRLGLGWYWIPTVHWGPAWVHWYWDSDIVAWCPLGYWNRPVVIINNHFYDRYGDPFVPVHSRSLVMVRKNQLQAPHHSRTLLRPEALRGVDRIRLQARQPEIKPVVGNTLKAPGLRTGSSMVREHNPNGLKRLSASQLRSTEKAGSGGRLSGGLSSGQLRREGQADVRQPEKAGSIRTYAPSSRNSSVGSRSGSDRAPTRISGDHQRQTASRGDDSRLRIDDSHRRPVSEQNHFRQVKPDQDSRLRTGIEPGQSAVRENRPPARPSAERRGHIKERPASSYQSRSPRVPPRPVDTERNSGQSSSSSRNSGLRESKQSQEGKLSYNLPSLSPPDGSSSVRKSNHQQERPAAVSPDAGARSRSSGTQSSSGSSSRAGHSVRKKNG
ncbi:MAG: hypothetical protein QME85_01710 [Candidatus Saccharicenans sp.]|nr:hypothetical protein [Candidatus Saccharicenans sp.]